MFTDVKDGEFYTDAVIWASSENVGVITGYAGGELFGPSDMVTREQMALMMYRYARYKGYDTTKASDLTGFPDKSEVSEFAEKAVSWAAAEGLLKGRSGKASSAWSRKSCRRCCSDSEIYGEYYKIKRCSKFYDSKF